MRIQLIVCGVVLGLASGAAHADQTAVLVAGDAPAREREVSQVAITDWVKTRPGSLVTASFNAKDTLLVTKCLRTEPKAEPWSCVSPVVPKGANRLVVGFVDSEPSRTGAMSFRLTAYLVTPSLTYAIVGKRHCDPCSEPTLRSLSGELAEAQFQRLAIARNHTLIAVNTTPRGVRVKLDGDDTGTSNTVIATFPGTHTVTLDLNGYHPETHVVEVQEDKQVEVKVTMRRKDPGPANPDARIAVPQTEPSPSFVSRWGPLALGITGVVVTAGGVGMILYDNDRDQGRTIQQREFYNDYRKPGIAFAVGGALVVGSAYLWHRYSGSKRTTVTAQPRSGGGAVQWTTSF